MDQMEFQEADLATDYQDKQDAVVDEDCDEDEDSDEDDDVLELRDEEKEEEVVNHYLILFWFAIIFIIMSLKLVIYFNYILK